MNVLSSKIIQMISELIMLADRIGGRFIKYQSKTLIAQVFEVSYFSAQLTLDISQDFKSSSKI
jgi:hypothetical protein